MLDQYGRSIDYMRISITDRCNLRCRYCMPDGVELLPMKDILTYEEIREICAAGAELGIRNLKITGGEPLARLGCADLIRSLKAIPGIEQVTLTTNGVLLGKYLNELTGAGLDAVNISLDTLNRERYALITGKDALPSVMESLDMALASPLRVKINTVPQRGTNDDEWVALASLARDRKLDVRFIEMMPIGFGKQVLGVSNDTIRSELSRHFPGMDEDPAVHGNGPAVYSRIPGWMGSIGFISAIHGRFCDSCNRVRVMSTGRIKPCLCYEETADLMPLLRAGASRDRLRKALEQAIYRKPKQHCFEDISAITETGRMSGIGG